MHAVTQADDATVRNRNAMAEIHTRPISNGVVLCHRRRSFIGLLGPVEARRTW